MTRILLFALSMVAACNSASDPTANSDAGGSPTTATSSGSVPSQEKSDAAPPAELQPPDANGNCPAGQTPYFYKAGCNGTVTPLCTRTDMRHGCLQRHCSCDGETFEDHCHQTAKAYRSIGDCDAGALDADAGDAGDAGDGG